MSPKTTESQCVRVAAAGSWCGLRMTMHGGPVRTCDGHDPISSCPAGYSSAMFAAMGDHGGNWYTCFKN
ncbi:MAG: hypothetical protein K8S27_01335 [Candidatus Omnitrophica bacterium]|nr:hypothetical protein [Candidatus Omnitrophota bacterium]